MKELNYFTSSSLSIIEYNSNGIPVVSFSIYKLASDFLSIFEGR